MRIDYYGCRISNCLRAGLLFFVMSTSASLVAQPATVDYQPLNPPVLLPDGTPFTTWSDTTKYTKTYHVDQNHQNASDDGPGTDSRPFRTINRAAQTVKAGERVVIHSGVYREMVKPRFSGEGPDRMISYESAPGAEVVVKGSRVVEQEWQRSYDPHERSRDGRFSNKLWMITLPDELFEEGYFPFRTPNASDAEIDLMEWALRWKGRIPYALPRGLIFQDGRRMVQLATYEDLVRVPGSYWVNSDGKTVHVHPYGSVPPQGVLFEVATQSHILRPEKPGLGFIRVSGLTLEHCANGFPRIGVGALLTLGGHHWIIENNVVRHVNSVAIEIGYAIFERRDPDPRNVQREDPDLGHVIVRNNRIYDAGTAGIDGFDVEHALVESNDIRRIGWQDVQYYAECAAIKLLITTGVLVRGNTITEVEAATGIWLDWNIKNSRVTRNVIHDSKANAAIFIEASQVPNLVDNNFIWDIGGQGIRLNDSDEQIVVHNLIARTGEDLVMARVATNRSLGGRKLTSERNKIVNNLFIDVRKPMMLDLANNTVDFNVYATTDKRSDQKGVRQTGSESHSISFTAETAHYNPAELLFTWRAEQTPPEVPAVPSVSDDFFGRPREGGKTVPGPFASLPVSAEIELADSR